MDLMSVQSEAQQIAVTISEVVGVDVVIVDSQLRRIADTFHYPDNVVPIRSNSIIGRIIETGQPLVVDNKNYYQSCVDCKDRALCNMGGFMGVPIRYEDTVAGAIGLAIVERNVKHLIENVNLILGFLQQMADFLAGKMTAQANYENIKTLSLERDSMLEASDTGVVLVDERGDIISCNQRFRSYFGQEGVAGGKRLMDCIHHPMIQQAMDSRTVQPGRTVVIPLHDQVFYGKLSSHPMWRDGTFCGTAFAFLNLYWGDDDQVTQNTESIRDTVLHLCGTRGTKKALELLEEKKAGTEPLLIKSSSRKWIVDLACAIHRESGRSGKFILLDTFGYTDTEAEQKLFGRAVSGISPYISNAMLLAHHGTLCICNVFLMPVFLQTRLRRYIQGISEEDSFRPDVRLLFAVSPIMEAPDLHFVDQELYRMLRAHEVCLPGPTEDPKRLRAYLDECLHFYVQRYGCGDLHFSPEAAAMLMDSYPWSTAVRQIRQAVEYLVRTCACPEISVEAVRSMLNEIGGSRRRSIQEIEQEEIQRLLQQGNSPDEIADILQISRSTLYRRIKKYQLQ